MEKNNGKIIAIVALVVAVVALSVGFAAFSDQLTINGTANVSAAANPFDDQTNGLAYDPTSESCVITGTSTAVGDPGTASDNAWSGISIPLNSENSSVTCTAEIENKTAYTAYLTSIAAADQLRCTSTGSNGETNASNVCSGATVTVSITDGTHTSGTLTITGSAQPSAMTTTNSVALDPTNGTATATVVISYTASALTDENVTMTIPTITHHYSSAAPAQQP